MSIESRLADVEEALRLLRDANRLQGKVLSAAAPGLGAVPRWNTITKKWDVGGLTGDLTTQFWFYTDFFRTSASDADPYFVQATTGTGAAFGNVVATASHQGVWSLATGTGTTGHTRLNTAPDSFIFSNGRIRFGAWIRTPGNLSGAGDRYEIYMGIIDASGSPPGTQEAIFLHYRDNVNSGKWEAGVENGGTGSVADTGTTVATSTWYYLELEINAAGDSVEYFIDGISKATISSGPASGTTAEARIGILKSAGTNSRLIHLDAAYLAGDLTTAR